MTEDEAYILIGKISTKFSNLEFGVTSIMEYLINSKNPAIGAILTKDMSLSKVIELIKKIIPFCFPEDSELSSQLGELLKEVDNIRVRRNLFIHGNWLFDNPSLEKNEVYCFDLRLKSFDNGKRLERLNKKVFTKQELELVELSLSNLVYKVFKIGSKIGASNLKVSNN